MRRLITVAVLLASASAGAHVGGVVANAKFTAPADPPTTPADGGVVLGAGYTFAAADQTFTVTWTDGDNDPTGRFFFYYLDHQPTFGVGPNDIESKATPAIEKNNPVVPVSVYAGCMCQDDAGVTCADFSGGLMRDCRNTFTWDTSAIAAGTWWLVAVNSDPPYHVYAAANAPVVISHGGAKPPAALVLVPDGFGSWDKTYRVQWIGQGTAPLHFDLEYGDEMLPLDPVHPLATDVSPILNADGTYSYDWDISGLASTGAFFLRVKVRDANGVGTFTDSRFGLSVFHPESDLGPSPDMSIAKPPQGCACELSSGTAATAVPLAMIVLTIGIAVRVMRRRT